MDDLFHNYADLPMEILLNIFRYLNFQDIRSASLVCRRWCEASQDYEFQSKVLLKFLSVQLSDDSLPGTLFLNSFRPFPNISLFCTKLGNVDNFFSHIGSTVEHIIIESVDITEEQLIAILKKTPKLKALTINYCGASLFSTGLFLELEANREAVTNSLGNVKEISLGTDQYLSDEILLRLTSLTPNLESLNIYGTNTPYVIAIQRRFYPQDRMDWPTKSILTFNGMLNVIENHVTIMKQLNLSNIHFEDSDMSLLANMKGLDLRRIDFIRCHQLNFVGLDTLLQSQKNLIELNLYRSQRICDRCITVICNHLTNLEVLKLRSCHNISHITEVSKLKRLKVLDISKCKYITSYSVQEGVAKTKNNNLRELYLSNLKLSEDCFIQCAENLPNLRLFDISYCGFGVTDKVVKAIKKNLIWLRFLSLDGCLNRGSKIENYLSGIFSILEDDPNIFKRYRTERNLTESGTSNNEQDSEAERRSSQEMYHELYQRFEDSFFLNTFKGLQTLRLAKCRRLTLVLFKEALKFLDLRELTLSQIDMKSDDFVKNCPAIEVLNLWDCYKINDKCIEEISQNLHRLRILEISGCKELTNQCLDYIADNCKVLEILDIRRCPHIRCNVKERLSCLSSLRFVRDDYIPPRRNW